MEVMYTTQATTIGGGTGHVKSEDGSVDLDLTIPKVLGGPGGDGTDPEQLFAAGFSACFSSALNMAARMKRVDIKDMEVTVVLDMIKNDTGGFIFGVNIKVKIPGIDEDVTKELIQMAENICPYSNSTRGNIRMEIENFRF